MSEDGHEDLEAEIVAAGIRGGAEVTAAAESHGSAGPVLRALSRRARRLDGELAACRKRETERAEALKRPGASPSYGDALMLFNADGNLAWKGIVPTGENFVRDGAGIGAGSPITRIELIREGPPPPQEVMGAQLAAIRKWSSRLGRDPERHELLAILNWQEVPEEK